MKLLTCAFACLLLTNLLMAQPAAEPPLDVLLIGTSHNYGKRPVEKFDYVIDKIISFKPDLVSGEYLSAEDLKASLPTHWNKQGIEAKLAYVKQWGYPAPKNPGLFITQQYQKVRSKPGNHAARIKLIHALFMKHDLGNANYQLYLLEQQKNTFTKRDTLAFRKALGPIDSLYQKYVIRTNEYYHMLFPAARRLGREYILPMDDQTYNKPWQGAWNAADSLFKKFEKNIAENSPEAAAYAVIYKRYRHLDSLEKIAAREGMVTRFLNTPEWGELGDMGNFYGGRRAFGIPGYPEEAVRQMYHYWDLRNQNMCRNLVMRARQAGSQRVAVVVGAGHRETMLKMLRAMPNVTVHTLN